MEHKTIKRNIKNPRLFAIPLFLIFSLPVFAQTALSFGLEVALYTGYSSNYGLDFISGYPFIEFQTGPFFASAFGGGGLSCRLEASYQFGGNLGFLLGDCFIGGGAGMAGPNLSGESALYPFVRGFAGVGDFTSGDNASYVKLYYDYNFNDNGYKLGILFGGKFSLLFNDAPARPVFASTSSSTRYPTITPEELKEVELFYAGTVYDIERRGKRMYINNISDRNKFIQKFHGNPNTYAVKESKNQKLPYYNIYEVSEKDIIRLVKQEQNLFLKVRMIHDWVSDIFIYDYDYAWYMDNVRYENNIFTLRQIVQRQRGVCFEYAILFWFLADAAGIDCYLISDRSKPGVGHAYNMVVIDGTGYIVDTTFDSGNRYENNFVTKFDRMISKDYFMLGVSESYRRRRW
ncbi:MAG: hypothetical protein Pg6A_01980 [Termitinemataceae bacterium]|nr:MAG: hypothetical protein Pg6A_01980 [Termitinemataceae bacterium]